MNRGSFFKKYFLKFSAALLLIGLIVYTVYHAIGTSSGSLLTTPARRITDVRIVSGQAAVFRDEEVLTVADGIVNPVPANGEKVSSGDLLAMVYPVSGSAEDREFRQLQLDRLNREIAVLEDSLLPAGSSLSGLRSYRDGAVDAQLEICRAVSGGDLRDLNRLEDEFLVQLNRYTSLTGSREAISERLRALRSERNDLLTGEGTEVLNRKSSGYFYDRSRVDGWESAFPVGAVETLTPEQFDAFASSDPVSADPSLVTVGKIVYGYRWYLAVRMTAEEAMLVGAGETYAVSFPENGGTELSLSCLSVNTGASGSVVIFSSDVNPENFSYQRFQSVQITVGSCSGYYLPERALHTSDGVDGVYVFEESTVFFRRVEILYRGDGYYIVAEQGDRGSEYLALNDLIVISGTRLYDGKGY